MPNVKALLGKLELHVVRGLMRLPPKVQVALSGKPAVILDGLTLSPQMQLLLALRERRYGKALIAETPEKARADLRRESIQPGARDRAGRVEDRRIKGPAGPIQVRHYAPPNAASPRPLLVFFHGGGFVTGDLDTHDGPCRLLCKEAGVHVLAVHYRRAPEHPFPAAVDDAEAALRWAVDHALELGADATRVGVGGDSAGANLSIALAQRGARGECPNPALQLLVYPPTDRVEDRPSMKHFAEGFLLTREAIDWFNECYFGYDWSLIWDPAISPLRVDDLSGQCPAILVTGGFDPLRDEGEAYAKALKNAGVPVRFKRYAGLVHGFFNMHALSPDARDAMLEIAGWLQEAFETYPAVRPDAA